MKKYNKNYDGAEDYNDRFNPTEDNITSENYNLEDKWYGIQQEYRNRYMDITDEDADVEPGRFDLTIDRIGRRRGKTPREIRTEIENW
jgi:hypothetical protein